MEALINDFGTSLTEALDLGAGAGSLVAVYDAAPRTGVRVRCRVYDPETLESEFVVLDLTAPKLWTVVEREAEDAVRFPRRVWPPGSQIEVGLVTALGLEKAVPVNLNVREFEQVLPADDVLIYHGLGYNPAVVVTDSAGTVVGVRVEHPDRSHVRVRAGAAFSFRVTMT